MDDNNIFQEFVNNVLEVATTRVCNEIIGFANNFSAFLAVTDQEIDLFVKEIHSYNSARPLNRKILILLNVPQYFKSLLFELKYRKMCGELTNELVLQEINIAHLNVMFRPRKESLEMIACRKDQSFPDTTVL